MADLKIFAKTVEPEVIEQVNLLLAQSAFTNCKVRIMPDTHAGKGCVIGFTANLGDKVIPNVVGVDIGCGMNTVRATKPVDLSVLDQVIRKYIPYGKEAHERACRKFDIIEDLRCYKSLRNIDRLVASIGSLGGGNHFIEVDESNDGERYLVIHTGSRNLGKQVAEYYQNLAYETMCGRGDIAKEQAEVIARLKSEGKASEIQNAIKVLKSEYEKRGTNIPKDLCYLDGSLHDDYLHDMQICQMYAVFNRRTIAEIIAEHTNYSFDPDDSFETIHNYIDLGTNIVRKGAIDASLGKRVLIPINMRDGCIVGVGKGNEDWNLSAPHGAGRLMSRTKAREVLSLSDYQQSMDGIFTTSVSEETIDEAPMAYKPMDEILEIIRDTVEIETIIKPIYNFKASE